MVASGKMLTQNSMLELRNVNYNIISATETNAAKVATNNQ